jgi:dienelactone hydrolase
LAYREGIEFRAWRGQVVETVKNLLKLPESQCDLDLRVSYEKSHEDHLERRLVFTAEPGADVPCHLLLPRTGSGPFPLMICLQGHTTGMHISLARSKFDGDAEAIEGERDFGLQAVRRGFAAFVMEQRCFGEREDNRPKEITRSETYERTDDNRTCKHAAMSALLVGRTLLGERVFDVQRACDLAATIAEVDENRIYSMGQSGGGTVSWYAAAVEPRLRGIIAASCFATLQSSIGTIDHCTDNYLPGMLEWLDFADLAGAIAPRTALIVMGRHDHLFPYDGVREAFEQASRIYAAAGASDALELVVGEEGHRFYADQAWPQFLEREGKS